MNISLADKEDIQKVFNKYYEIIQEKNQIDMNIYNYIRDHIFPKYKILGSEKCNKKGKRRIIRGINMLLY